MVNNMGKLVYGVGINDADYTLSPLVNGKQVRCRFYQRWLNMLERCYVLTYQKSNPTYADCYVCTEWLTFSNFKKWMETQNWQGKSLDKDILVVGNKVYSPETCVFVDLSVNNFTTDGANRRGEYLLGVRICKETGKFKSHCSNPFKGRVEHLGVFICQDQAHQAWKKRKHELACQLADLQADNRVASALRLRYAPA